MVQNKYLDIAKKLMIFVIIVDVVITFFNIILSMIGQTDNPLLSSFQDMAIILEV